MKIFYKIISIILVAIVCMITYKYLFANKKIYDLDYISSDRKVISTINFNTDNKYLFVNFSTDCNSCITILKEINDSLKYLNKLNLILVVAQNDWSTVDRFLINNNLKQLIKYTYLDTQNSFSRDFGLGMGIIETYPKIVLFDHKKRYTKEIKTLANLYN